MIMSYLAKIGMSYFDIECPFMKGGHYVRRGHCHVEYEGVKKASCYRSGNGDEGHASRGREGIRVNGSTDPQGYLAGLGRRGGRGRAMLNQAGI